MESHECVGWIGRITPHESASRDALPPLAPAAALWHAAAVSAAAALAGAGSIGSIASGTGTGGGTGCAGVTGLTGYVIGELLSVCLAM